MSTAPETELSPAQQSVKEPAWTPGQWRAHKHRIPELNNEEWIILSDYPGVNEGDSLVAMVNSLEGADAHLLAAAKDMYKALESLLHAAVAVGGLPEYGQVLVARRALAKARAEQT